MADLLVVASKVKESVSASGCNMAGDFPEALSAEVEALVDKACQRAKANGRKTASPKDL